MSNMHDVFMSKHEDSSHILLNSESSIFGENRKGTNLVLTKYIIGIGYYSLKKVFTISTSG